MNYNDKKINERIYSEIIDAGYSKTSEKFWEQVGCARQTFDTKLNQGGLLSLDVMTKMCEIFDCELGYLLCEYDVKHKEYASTCELTGLSENTINALQYYKKEMSDVVTTIDTLLQNDTFLSTLTWLTYFKDESIKLKNMKVELKKLSKTNPNPTHRTDEEIKLVKEIGQIGNLILAEQWKLSKDIDNFIEKYFVDMEEFPEPPNYKQLLDSTYPYFDNKEE